MNVNICRKTYAELMQYLHNTYDQRNIRSFGSANYPLHPQIFQTTVIRKLPVTTSADPHFTPGPHRTPPVAPDQNVCSASHPLVCTAVKWSCPVHEAYLRATGSAATVQGLRDADTLCADVGCSTAVACACTLAQTVICLSKCRTTFFLHFVLNAIFHVPAR